MLYYRQRSFIDLIWVTLLMISFTLASCASIPIDMHKAARGYWETVPGKPPPDLPGRRVYASVWYAIGIGKDNAASVEWYRGTGWCIQTNGQVVGNEIRLIVDDVATTFTIHDDTHATVTFRWGQTTYVKQLKKTRDDPNVGCY